MSTQFTPEIERFVNQLFQTDPEKFWGSTIPELYAMVDRALDQRTALEILTQAWSQLFLELEDQPTWEELQAWKTLKHAREYLENSR